MLSPHMHCHLRSCRVVATKFLSTLHSNSATRVVRNPFPPNSPRLSIQGSGCSKGGLGDIIFSDALLRKLPETHPFLHPIRPFLKNTSHHASHDHHTAKLNSSHIAFLYFHILITSHTQKKHGVPALTIPKTLICPPCTPKPFPPHHCCHRPITPFPPTLLQT